MDRTQDAPTETRYTRQAKPTVRLRRPTCTELLGRPDLVAQLVLDVSAAA